MTKRNSHAIDELELMAYLDGELSRERAAAAATHLEACPECKALANELRGISREMAGWQVESSSAEIPPAISKELEAHLHSEEKSLARRRNLRWHGWGMRQATVAGLAVVVVVSLVFFVAVPPLKRDQKLAEKALLSAPPQAAAPTRTLTYIQPLPEAKDKSSFSVDGQPPTDSEIRDRSLDTNGLLAPKPTPPFQGQADSERKIGEQAIKNGQPPIASGPMVIRTAELALTTTNFDQSRARVEEILRRYNGYLGGLTVSQGPNSARTLIATLRVPAYLLDTALADLKKLGRVDSESQKGEEVSQQYVDLQARLLNARNSEQRLTELLHRAGKLSDVLAVEEQIENVRESIERMEAERDNLTRQVSFSTLNMRISEDYKEHVQVVPESTSTRLRNAAVEGYEMLVGGLINLLEFLISWGPSLLLWGVVLFFPARLIWRKTRRGLL